MYIAAFAVVASIATDSMQKKAHYKAIAASLEAQQDIDSLLIIDCDRDIAITLPKNDDESNKRWIIDGSVRRSSVDCIKIEDRKLIISNLRGDDIQHELDVRVQDCVGIRVENSPNTEQYRGL